MHKKVVNSPGMKAALNASRLENAGVRGKVESFENKKVQRIKVSISPNKMRRKEVSENIKSKLVKYDKNDKKDKEVIEDKKDKIASYGSSSESMIKMLKDNLEESVSVKRFDIKPTNDVDTENSKSIDKKVLRNAFDVLLESKQGGKIKSNTPQWSKKRKKIGMITPNGKKGKNQMEEWLKRGREN